MKKMYREILTQLKQNNDVVLASIYKSVGSTPRSQGAKMACFENGTTVGTVGGGAVEFDCTKKASQLFKTKASYKKQYTLNNDTAASIGMVCGGVAYIYFQYIESNKKNIAIFERIDELLANNTRSWLISKITDNETLLGVFDAENGLSFLEPDTDIKPLCNNTPTLSSDECYFAEPLTQCGIVYIFGGGHVSQALVPLLSMTDFVAVVFEDSEKFADKALFPTAQNVINASFFEIDKHINITEDDYAVVLTRGHKSDNEVVRQILSKHPSYLGVIGSKKKVSFMHDYLAQCGFSKVEIERIKSPIGLSIGAQTPSEIAVSIVAELISHRSQNI